MIWPLSAQKASPRKALATASLVADILKPFNSKTTFVVNELSSDDSMSDIEDDDRYHDDESHVPPPPPPPPPPKRPLPAPPRPQIGMKCPKSSFPPKKCLNLKCKEEKETLQSRISELEAELDETS